MHSAVVLLTESSHFKLCSNVLISPLEGEWCLFKCAILIDHNVMWVLESYLKIAKWIIYV